MANPAATEQTGLEGYRKVLREELQAGEEEQAVVNAVTEMRGVNRCAYPRVYKKSGRSWERRLCSLASFPP